jgi:predicted PurR-regulated permease PerM
MRASLGVIAFVTAVAGMKAAESFLIPILMSAFLAAIAAPVVFWLRRKGVPSGLGVLVVVIGIMGILTILGTLVGTSLNQFTEQIPFYRQQLEDKLLSLIALLPADLFDIGSVRELVQKVDPGSVMNLTAGMLTGLSNVLTKFFLILLTVVFILLEASSLPRKLTLAFGESNLDRFGAFTESLRKYLALKTMVSLVTGTLAWAWVASLGVDYPLLWGLLAFLLNYIPSVGSIIAALPPILLAIVQFGLGRALAVAAGYAVINVLMGNIIEPRLMGRNLGLSPLVVFLSLLFWGFIFGPVGMLLSVPLTMTFKIGLETSEETQWLAILLGPPIPEEAKAKPAPAAE